MREKCLFKWIKNAPTIEVILIQKYMFNPFLLLELKKILECLNNSIKEFRFLYFYYSRLYVHDT